MKENKIKSYSDNQTDKRPVPFWLVTTIWIPIIIIVPILIHSYRNNRMSLKEMFQPKTNSNIEVTSTKTIKKTTAFQQEEYKQILMISNHKGKGKEIYQENCLSCHEEQGKGDIGPNLTDEYWLWADGTPETIYNMVYNGKEENGMPPWHEILSKEEIYLVTEYVISLQGLELENEKEPQGRKIK